MARSLCFSEFGGFNLKLWKTRTSKIEKWAKESVPPWSLLYWKSQVCYWDRLDAAGFTVVIISTWCLFTSKTIVDWVKKEKRTRYSDYQELPSGQISKGKLTEVWPQLIKPAIRKSENGARLNVSVSQSDDLMISVGWHWALVPLLID